MSWQTQLVQASCILDEYEHELEVVYREECYRVRDNGAVFRLARLGRRSRPLDEQWTFGRQRPSTGYMHIGNVPVHRVVCSAFHGDAPSNEHIVDHIDTNRANNRPDNLRWLTRLENVLLNPISARRIEFVYGSIEAFFEDPTRPETSKTFPDISWMRTVTKEEAQQCKIKLQDWARSGQIPSGGALGEWLFQVSRAEEKIPETDEVLVEALTQSAVQRNWKTPCEFPCCPDDTSPSALHTYANCLKPGAVFAQNDYGKSITVRREVTDASQSLLVICQMVNNPIKDWSLARVSIENDKFVHESLGTYFELVGVTKQFDLERGALGPWQETIDDYC